MNHVPIQAWERWIAAQLSCHADGLIISGDVSEGDDVCFQLQRLSEAVDLPIYFVLGNHDFYQNSIAGTRRKVIEASRDHDRLFYLTDLSAIRLAPRVVLLGEDGWGDATVGDFEDSTVRLNDFSLIDEFRDSDPNGWKELLQQQGRESADRLAAKLENLPADTDQVVVLTHVPPFREACWYEGKTTDDNWAPFFVCGQLGAVLRQAACSRPDCRITVLCGHTHHAGIANITDNLIVHTGGANYGNPAVEGVLNIESQSLSITNRRRE
ncbi:MAG: metallophosphoesterase [Pirellulales bacterium]|nr:metallophosphoesterase [Pirellulales bacterium]